MTCTLVRSVYDSLRSLHVANAYKQAGLEVTNELAPGRRSAAFWSGQKVIGRDFAQVDKHHRAKVNNHRIATLARPLRHQGSPHVEAGSYLRHWRNGGAIFEIERRQTGLWLDGLRADPRPILLWTCSTG